MSAEKLEAVYLVDRQFFLHLKETESGFQYEAFHRSEKKENYSGMLTWEDLLESRIASPLAAARVAVCEEIGLEGQEVAKISLLSLLPYPRLRFDAEAFRNQPVFPPTIFVLSTAGTRNCSVFRTEGQFRWIIRIGIMQPNAATLTITIPRLETTSTTFASLQRFWSVAAEPAARNRSLTGILPHGSWEVKTI